MAVQEKPRQRRVAAPDGAILATDVWKRFRADRRRAFFQDEVARFADRMRGRTGKSWRWALRDIDLEVEPGDSVGLIGANGSGKTTLLKILTRVMYQTAGHVEVRGRVGALIAVSAGIHPNLTGRERCDRGCPVRARPPRFGDAQPSP